MIYINRFQPPTPPPPPRGNIESIEVESSVHSDFWLRVRAKEGGGALVGMYASGRRGPERCSMNITKEDAVALGHALIALAEQ